jgi:AraC-like DNA-binding protein
LIQKSAVMTLNRFSDSARYWRSPLAPGADMLTAEYHDHSFTPHWHDAYTVPVIEAGAECYDYRGSHYVAEAGSVPVINPGELHTGARAVDAGWRYRVFYLPVEFVQAVASEVSGRAEPLPWFPADIIRDGDLARRLALAHRALEAGTDPLAAETALLDALSSLLARHAGQRPSVVRLGSDAVRVEAMKARLTDDLTAPVTLAELAASVGLSTFHAARLFTRETGLAPHAWRNQMRLARSLGALRAGVSVTEVAAGSGFTDQSHFTRHFKRAFGVPPGRWR